MQLQSLAAATCSRQEHVVLLCCTGKPNARTLQLFAQEQRGLIHHPPPRASLLPPRYPLSTRARALRRSLARGALGLSAAD